MTALRAVVVLALVGCASSHRQLELDVFLEEVARVRCEADLRCHGRPDAVAWHAAAPEIACTELFPVRSPIADPARVTFDPDRAAECLARLADDCSSAPLETICPGLFVGHVGEEGECASSLECAPELQCVVRDFRACVGRCLPRTSDAPCTPDCPTCAPDASGISRCVAPRAREVGSGEPCLVGDGVVARCPPLHVCDGVCQPPLSEGEPCEGWPRCAVGLTCDEGICQPILVAALGTPCDDRRVLCDRFHGEECRAGRCEPVEACAPAWDRIDCGPGMLCDEARHECRRAPAERCE